MSSQLLEERSTTSSILHQGRAASTRKDVVKFISSIESDRRIATATVLVNEAHVIALAKSGVATRNEARKLLAALRKLEQSISLRQEIEDIHLLIEERVSEQVGSELGGKLHTGKSRNDQVATAIRISLRESLLELSSLLVSFIQELLRTAKTHRRTLFVGYTHLQPAQPITFAHYLLAVGDSFLRDYHRVLEVYDRVNMSPMGAGALAGTSFKIDRSQVARLLGFDGLVENSLDAVTNRDFVLDVLAVCSIVAVDLSRLAQDLIFYSSADVGLIDLPDEFTSTSSIMPQKKNPDPLEIIRARSSMIMSNFSSAATALHALPTGYNLDFQELTPLLWDSMDTSNSCLKILVQLIPRLKVNNSIAEKAPLQSTASTEIANVLVREEGVPFRTAHGATGRSVRKLLEMGHRLGDVEQEHWEKMLGRTLRDETFQGLREALDLRKHIELYKTRGSPNPKETERMILDRLRQLAVASRSHAKTREKLRHSFRILHSSLL